MRVSPRAKHNIVAGIANGFLLVRTTAAPADGKANKAIIKLLAKYVDVPPSRIDLLRGATARNKVFVVRKAAIGL